MTDPERKPTGVIVPIELWRKLESEQETAYLLKSGAMKKRLMDAMHRQGGFTIEDACRTLGI